MLSLTQRGCIVGDDRSKSRMVYRTLDSLHGYGRQVTVGTRWLSQAREHYGAVPDPGSQPSELGISASAALKLLVVEDECIIALDLMSTLGQMGYRVTGHAISGEEALDEAAKSQPDLVLMDIRLKGSVSGIQAAQQINARFGVPVIFLTAYSDDATLHDAKAAGMSGLLHKPFSNYQLEEAIMRALRNPASE